MASPVFVVGCPRSGTHLLAELFRNVPQCVSRHCEDIDKATGDSFLGYSKWYDLPVNTKPLVAFRRQLIEACAPEKVYVEANCYLSLFTRELHDAFGCRIVFLVREPADVVNSLYEKGWYEDPVFAAPSFDYNVLLPNHAFGRLMPPGPDEFERWKRLSRIGRIAWFYNAMNLKILAELRSLPRKCWSLLRVDQCDYAGFVNLQKQLADTPVISEATFEAVARRRPGRASRHRTQSDWTARELREFEAECDAARKVFELPSA